MTETSWLDIFWAVLFFVGPMIFFVDPRTRTLLIWAGCWLAWWGMAEVGMVGPND